MIFFSTTVDIHLATRAF